MSACATAASPRSAKSWRAPTRWTPAGCYVMPGGVDTHCHIEQLRPNGGADEESFVTGSTACLAGGTTTVITFAAQFKGHGIRDTLAEYHRRASKAMVDYSFHQIITDPSDTRGARRNSRGRGVGRAQPEGVPDLRAVASGRPRVHPRAGGGAAHRCAGDGALRELRGDPLAHRGADGGWPQRAEISFVVAARRWWSARRPIARSRWPRWWTSRSRCSTCRARRWRRRSRGRRRAG